MRVGREKWVERSGREKSLDSAEKPRKLWNVFSVENRHTQSFCPVVIGMIQPEVGHGVGVYQRKMDSSFT